MVSPDEFFNRRLNAFQRGEFATYETFDLGSSPNLGVAEFPPANVYMHQAIIRKTLIKHSIAMVTLKNLPAAIRRPLRLFRSKSEAGSYILELSIIDRNQSLVVALARTDHPDFGGCYFIKSIHRRPEHQLLSWEHNNLLLYKKYRIPLEDSARCNCGQQPKVSDKTEN